MEQFTSIRLILPPLVLLRNLLLGAWVAGCINQEVLMALKIEVLTAIGGIIAFSIIPVGFVIGGLSTTLQTFAHWLTPRRFERWEVRLPRSAWEIVASHGPSPDWQAKAREASRVSEHERAPGAFKKLS